MLLVSKTAVTDATDRDEIDRTAREIVLQGYRGAPTGNTREQATTEQARFDAALDAYQRSFSYVPKAIARQAVAFIIASEEAW